jgi:hypothetical protein
MNMEIASKFEVRRKNQCKLLQPYYFRYVGVDKITGPSMGPCYELMLFGCQKIILKTEKEINFEKLI